MDRVALPDAPLDDSAVEEAALIAKGLPFLRPAWSNRDWQVWEVVDSPGLVDGPAQVVAVDIDSVTLDVTAPGDVMVRVRGSAFWTTDPAVCVEPTEDGWIVLRDAPVGRLAARTGRVGPADARRGRPVRRPVTPDTCRDV